MKRAMTGAVGLAGIGLALGACTSTSTPAGTSSPTSAPATSAPATTPSTPAQSPGTVAVGKLVASGTHKQESGKGPLELFSRLTGGSSFSRAAGSSEYDQEDSFRELDVWLANVGGLAGHQVSVHLNCHRVGSVTVSGTGRGFRKWDTEHGQNAPPASAGGRPR